MTKKILFFPLNSPGHINSSLGIADKFRNEFNYETIFLIIGQMMGSDIQDHGHKLIHLEEAAIFEDYPISEDEDTMKPLDEASKLKRGRRREKYGGCLKWPQVVLRYQYLIRLPPLESFAKSLTTMEKIMTSELIENHENISRVLNEVDPDLIVIDAYFVPPCIVNWTKCPWVRLFSANPLGLYKSKLANSAKPVPNTGCRLYTKEERKKLQQENPEEWNKMLEGWLKDGQFVLESLMNSTGEYQKFLDSCQCPKLQPGEQAHNSPYINLYMFPKELDYDQDDDLFELPDRWFRCDSLMRKPANVDISKNEKIQYWSNKFNEAVVGKKAVIYFSLGTIASGDFRLLRKYVEVFKKDTSRLYIISKGINGDRFELNDENMIGANFLPQTFLLPKADIAIIHGGNNSLTECFYYGKPAIVLPAFADQIDNGQRVQDLQLGYKLDCFEIDEEKLMQTIDTVLADTKMAERCRAIGAQMRARDDARKATLILKKLTEDGHLNQEFIEECRNKNADEICWC